MALSSIMALKNVTPSTKAPAAAGKAPAPEQPVGGDQVVINSSDAQPTVTERLLDSNTVAQLVGTKMKAGETVTISSNGQTVLEIHKDSVSGYSRFKSFATDAVRAASYEVSNIVGQDPAFAFKESALGVKDQVMKGIPTDLQSFAEKGFLPMIRVVALALDGKKAVDTFKNPDASRVDKFVDGAHLVTDVAGLGGAVAFAIPSIGPGVATALTVAGLMGDVAAYGYHVMKYFADRGIAPPDPNDPNQPTDPNQPPVDPGQPTDPNQPPTNPVVPRAAVKPSVQAHSSKRA